MFEGNEEAPTIAIGIEDDDGPQSIQDRLRAKRQHIADTHETYIQLPGFEDAGLQVKYRMLDREDVKRIAKNIQGANGAKRMDRADFQMLLLMDTIINATEGFYTQEPQDNGPQPLMESDDETSPHITTWTQMSKFMDPDGIGEDRQRAALQFCFAGNEFAIGQHGINVQRWMTNTNLDVNEAFLGEGGVTGQNEEIGAAAAISYSGQSIEQFLQTRDDFEIAMMSKIAEERIYLETQLQDRLANAIIQELAKRMK